MPSLAWEAWLGPLYVNLTTVLLGLFVLALTVIQRLRVKKRTPFLEVSLLLFLLGFLFLTFHGGILQIPFPIAMPEKPMLDNNLTFNFALTNLLVYLVFPVLLLVLVRSDVSLKKLGLKVSNPRHTILYVSLGTMFSVLVFSFSYVFFGYRWVSTYTAEGFILWVLLVTVFSVFLQALFYLGILFNKYLDDEYAPLLAVISLSAYMSFNNVLLPWLVSNVILQSAKIVVTWKTRNIYGAALMSIGIALLDILTQFV